MTPDCLTVSYRLALEWSIQVASWLQLAVCDFLDALQGKKNASGVSAPIKRQTGWSMLAIGTSRKWSNFLMSSFVGLQSREIVSSGIERTFFILTLFTPSKDLIVMSADIILFSDLSCNSCNAQIWRSALNFEFVENVSRCKGCLCSSIKKCNFSDFTVVETNSDW